MWVPWALAKFREVGACQVNLHLKRRGLAGKPVRHQDLVLLVAVGDGQDVGALERLVLVAKDIVDVDDALRGIIGAGGVYIMRRSAIVLARICRCREHCVQVFRPPRVLYSPLISYPWATVGIG